MRTGSSTQNRSTHPTRVTRVPKDVVIDIRSESDTPRQVSELIKEWQQHTKPFNLTLEGSDDFTNKEREAIGNALLTLHHLVQLTIPSKLFKSISSEALDALGMALAETSSLSALELHIDSLHATTIQVLAENLRMNKSITHLHLKVEREHQMVLFLHYLGIQPSDPHSPYKNGMSRLQHLTLSPTFHFPDYTWGFVLSAFTLNQRNLQSIDVSPQGGNGRTFKVRDRLLTPHPMEDHPSARKQINLHKKLLASRNAFGGSLQGLLSTIAGQHVPQDVASQVLQYLWDEKNSIARREYTTINKRTRAASINSREDNLNNRIARLLELSMPELEGTKNYGRHAAINHYTHTIIKEFAIRNNSNQWSQEKVQASIDILQYCIKTKEKIKRMQSNQEARNDHECLPRERPTSRKEYAQAALQCVTSSIAFCIAVACSLLICSGIGAFVWFVIMREDPNFGEPTPTPSPST